VEKFTQKFHSATGGAATVLAIFLFPVKETLISFLPSEHIMTFSPQKNSSHLAFAECAWVE
jgi:hypothetical protein